MLKYNTGVGIKLNDKVLVMTWLPGKIVGIKANSSVDVEIQDTNKKIRNFDVSDVKKVGGKNEQ